MGKAKLIGSSIRYLEAFAFAIVAAVIKALPLDLASRLSGLAWRNIAPLNRRHARADAQLAASLPEIGESQRAVILSSMWDNLGRTAAETFHLAEILEQGGRIEITAAGRDAISVAKESGAIFVLLHLGNWELGSALLAREGLKLAGIYQRIGNPHVEAAVLKLRADFYPGGLWPKSHKAARDLLRIAKQGGTIGLLGDLRDFRGAAVPFFNRPAPSTTFPAMVARQTGLPLFVAKIMRTEGVRFEADAERISVDRSNDKESDVRAVTVAIQAVFERWIRQSPGQWMWGHRRWG